MKIQILNRWSLSVVFEAEVDSDSPRFALGLAVKLAIDKKIVLRNADLRNAVLRNADLRNADLSGADLRNADLSGADLRNADLSGADLRNADLSGAVLRNADLRNADLSGAVLRNADLRNADLDPIKHDVWAILAHAPREVPALIEALKSGRVNGSVYTDGECGCLIGTLSIASGTSKNDAVGCSRLGLLYGNSSRPAESFFLGINKGDTPETSQHCKLALEWCEEWYARVSAAFVAPVIA